MNSSDVWKMLAVLIVAVLLAAPAQATAEDARPDQVLEELLLAAIDSSPAVAAEVAATEQAEHAAAAADRLPDPVVGIGFASVAVETRGGPQRARISVEQAFPFAGKRDLRQQVAESAAVATGHRGAGTAANVIGAVKSTFWEIYRIDRAIGTAAKEARLLADIVSAVDAKYATGYGHQAHLLQAQLMQTRIANRLLLLRGSRRAAAGRMTGIIGRDVTVPMLAVTDWSPLPTDRDELIEAATQANPELAAGAARIRQARFAVDLAHKELYPDFALSLNWGEVGDSDLPGDFNGRDVWSVGAKFKLPLYRGDIRDRERSAQAGLRAAEERWSDRRHRIGAEVADAIDRIESVGASVDLYLNGLLPQAESTFESAMAAYSTGELDFADLILAENSLLDVELGLHETVAHYYQLVARLDRLIGSKDGDTLFPLRDRS